MPSVFAFIKKILLGKYISSLCLKMWLAGQFFILSKNITQCIIYDTSNFFILMAEKHIFKLNHRIIKCIYL